MEQFELLRLVEETLEVEPGTVSLTADLDELEWDSLANISFIAEIDARLNVGVDADRLSRAKTPLDLWELVQTASNLK